MEPHLVISRTCPQCGRAFSTDCGEDYCSARCDDAAQDAIAAEQTQATQLIWEDEFGLDSPTVTAAYGRFQLVIMPRPSLSVTGPYYLTVYSEDADDASFFRPFSDFRSAEQAAMDFCDARQAVLRGGMYRGCTTREAAQC